VTIARRGDVDFFQSHCSCSCEWFVSAAVSQEVLEDASAELTRRGYLVSLTFGNAPTSDLLVQSPQGAAFTVDVKGQSTRNFWLFRQLPPKPNHFFILIYLPPQFGPPRYFILASDELMRHRDE
jgi:hypothetical protein